MSEYKIASRYAKALFDISVEKGVLNDVKKDIEHMLHLTDESRDLQVFLESPLYKMAIKKEAIDKMPLSFKNGGINLTGEAAWNKWKRWADLNRRDDYVYKVLDTIKRQGYFATPKQHQVLVTWFNRKR